MTDHNANTTGIQTDTSPKSQNHLHSGHRMRLKNRFIASNGKDFTDHELLELLLFYAIPRVNTNELSHKLINEFGSLGSVLNAPPEAIESIEGAGKSTSLFLMLQKEIVSRVVMEKHDQKTFVADSLSKVGNFLFDYYKSNRCEEFCVMLLDNSFRLIEFTPMSVGSVNTASVDVRRVTKYALTRDASFVILSHNHPSGTLSQSTSDRLVTVQLEAALHAIGISLMEHIIVNDVGFAPTMHLRTTSPTRMLDLTRFKNFYEH